jgi:hypothetical protein
MEYRASIETELQCLCYSFYFGKSADIQQTARCSGPFGPVSGAEGWRCVRIVAYSYTGPRNGVAGGVEIECRLVGRRSSMHRDCNLVHEYSFFIGGPERVSQDLLRHFPQLDLTGQSLPDFV